MKKISLLSFCFIGLFSLLSFKIFADPTNELWRAVRNNNLERAEKAIAQGADVNALDKEGVPILWWAAYESDVEIVRLIVQKGSNYSPKKARLESCGNLTGIAAGENKLELIRLYFK